MDARRLSVASTVVAAIFVVSGCASPPVPTLTPKPRPSSTVAPTPTPPPTGPLAVLVTNSARTGTSYDVLVIDLKGRIVARATASLPLLKQNQTVQPALVSASASTVYYLNGDTDIWSLPLTGHSTLVKSISAGAMLSLGFAVSIDDSRVAVAAMKQTPNTTGSTVTATSRICTTPAVTSTSGQTPTRPRCAGRPDGMAHRSSTTSIAAVVTGANTEATGVREDPRAITWSMSVATETRWPCVRLLRHRPRTATLTRSRRDSPPSAGTACTESGYTYPPGVAENEIYAVDWTGAERSFVDVKSTNGGAPLSVNGCFLALDGNRIACADNSSQALTLLTSDILPRSPTARICG